MLSIGPDERPGVGPELGRRHHVVGRDQRSEPIPIPAIEAVERLVNELDIPPVHMLSKARSSAHGAPLNHGNGTHRCLHPEQTAASRPQTWPVASPPSSIRRARPWSSRSTTSASPTRPARSSPTSCARRASAASRSRLLYNVDSGRPSELHPPPRTRPEILAELPIDARPVPGIPDLMHHKYVVRDGEAVWAGSANWTIDSWTRQENVLAVIESEQLAARFRQNFEELWARPEVARSGKVDPEPVDVGGVPVTAWFTPGHGERALAPDRDGHRLFAAQGADRIARDHFRADPGHPRRARRQGRPRHRRRGRRPADRDRVPPVGRERAHRLEDPPAGCTHSASFPSPPSPPRPGHRTPRSTTSCMRR